MPSGVVTSSASWAVLFKLGLRLLALSRFGASLQLAVDNLVHTAVAELDPKLVADPRLDSEVALKPLPPAALVVAVTAPTAQASSTAESPDGFDALCKRSIPPLR